MTLFLAVFFGTLAAWLILGMSTVGMDEWARRRHAEHLDARAWDEKVRAMRRLYDEGGDE